MTAETRHIFLWRICSAFTLAGVMNLRFFLFTVNCVLFLFACFVVLFPLHQRQPPRVRRRWPVQLREIRTISERRFRSSALSQMSTPERSG
jgi:hypothetical protein